jgi:hypothetical protein
MYRTKSELEKEIIDLKTQIQDNRGRRISVVYPYVHEADGPATFAQWEELRYSMRSLKNLNANFEVFVVGDDPGWFSDKVNYIPLPRICDNPPLDIINKLNKAIEHPDITDDFIWMNDDIYIINRVELWEVYMLKAMNNLAKLDLKPKNLWYRNLIKTYEKLRQLKCSTWNYSTHLPFVYNKQKMQELIEVFDLENESYLITTLYHNYFYPKSLPLVLNVKLDDMKVAAYRKDFDYDLMKRFFVYKKFFNHSVHGFSDKVKRILSETFPEPSVYET